MICCGRLCSTAGSDRTATGQPRRATIARTCPASAPQATISSRRERLCSSALTPRERLCSSGGTPPLTPRKRQLLDEAVVEVGAVGELDIPHLLEQRQAAGPLAQAEQRHLRPLAGHVARGHHP